jgi:hypothetical protein
MRCGGQAEAGEMGVVSLHPLSGAGVSWFPAGPRRWGFRRREPLLTAILGRARAPAQRCTTCRLVWFHYPPPA